MKTLLTLGCSWTFGVGANYTPAMSREEYMATAWSDAAEKNSFRTLLSKKYNLNNINCSLGGSSNQRQFRLAEECFFNHQITEKKYNDVKDPSWPEFTSVDDVPDHIRRELIEVHKIKKPDIVLWAITSVARNEVWNINTNDYENFFYHHKTDFAKFWLRNIYDYDESVCRLTSQMLLWNNYFKANDIKVIWVDTFNVHNYQVNIDGMIRPGDLLSALLGNNEVIDDSYHESIWENDSERIDQALKLGLVNPISYHPTAKGHQRIADFLSPYLEELL